MAIFKEALNPFGKVFGDMSPSGKSNAYANSIMFNAMGNKLAEGRQLAAANNLSYGGVNDNGEHIFAPAGVYQPMQEAAEGIAGLLDSRPLPPVNEMFSPPTPQEGPKIFPPTHGDPLPPEMLPPPIYDFDYPDPAPPPNSQVIDPSFQQPITDDPYQYAQPEFALPDTRSPIVQEEPPIFYEDPIIPDPPMVVQGEVPGAGYIEDEFAPKEFPIEDPVAVGAPIDTASPIGQPIDTGTNPFYTGATNVAQPPSMTPVAPSFSLDVGMGGYGTPTNTAGFGNYDVGNIGVGGFGGFNIPTPTTVPYPTGNYSDQVAVVPNEPQTTTTALPTVNSFAGFNGFGGFGGF